MSIEDITWDIDGLPVALAWDSCDMTANGGFNTLSSVSVPAHHFRDSFQQGSVITGTRPNGDTLWQGYIAAPAKVSAGDASFNAVGFQQLIRNQNERLPYQVADGTQWSQNHEQPFGYAESEKFNPTSKNDSIGLQIQNGTVYATNNRGGFALLVQDWSAQRVAFTIRKATDNADFELELRGGSDAGTLSAITTWTMGASNPDGTTKDYSISGNYDTLSLGWVANTGGTAAVNQRFWLDNLRVNYIGEDDSTTTSDVVTDVGQRVGFSTAIQKGSIGVLPLDYSGTWDALLDYMAAIEGYCWLVLDNPRGQAPAQLVFRDWGNKDWETSTDMADTSGLVPAPLYNRVTTYFERPAGVPQHRTAKPTDFDLDDPFPAGVTFEYPDPLTLTTPQRSHDLADAVNQRILTRMLKYRLQGSCTVQKLSRGHPFDIQAGDTLQVHGIEPIAGPQRVVGVTYHADGTADVTLDRLYDLNALLFRLETTRSWRKHSKR